MSSIKRKQHPAWDDFVVFFNLTFPGEEPTDRDWQLYEAGWDNGTDDDYTPIEEYMN